MRIAIEVDGVLRDTFSKIEQIYQKFFIDELELVDEDFQFEIVRPFDTPDFKTHFKFKTDEEYLSFIYEEFAMQIFGHSPSTHMSTFQDLNEIYRKYKDDFEFVLISEQVGKTKPATLLFISKFGCEIDRIIFYNKLNEEKIWKEFDILLASNPHLLQESKDKTLIKFETSYNSSIKIDKTISNLKEFEEELKKLKNND